MRSRRSRSSARRRWPGTSSSSPGARRCRSPGRRCPGSTPRGGSGRRSTPACSASRSGRAAAPEGVPVFADLGAAAPASEMGFAAGRLVADLDAYRAVAFADGRLPADLAAGAEARRRRRDGADPRGGVGAAPQQARRGGRRRAGFRLSPAQGGRPAAAALGAAEPGGDRDPAADRRGHGADRARGAGLWALPAGPRRGVFDGGSRRSTAASRRSPCSASGRTASPRTRWPSRACTRPRRSAPSGRSRGGR